MAPKVCPLRTSLIRKWHAIGWRGRGQQTAKQIAKTQLIFSRPTGKFVASCELLAPASPTSLHPESLFQRLMSRAQAQMRPEWRAEMRRDKAKQDVNANWKAIGGSVQASNWPTSNETTSCVCSIFEKCGMAIVIDVWRNGDVSWRQVQVEWTQQRQRQESERKSLERPWTRR